MCKRDETLKALVKEGRQNTAKLTAPIQGNPSEAVKNSLKTSGLEYGEYENELRNLKR